MENLKAAKELTDLLLVTPASERYKHILRYLQDAYLRGFEAADANPRQPESMGR